MKALIKFMSEKNNFAYVCSATNADDKQKRIAELKRRFEQSNFSAVASFSADIADCGNESGVYDSDDFATFNSKAKQHTAFNDIKRLTLVHSVKDSVKTYLLQRNEVIKANKDKAKLKQKGKENKHVSHPNWY
jgi:beta-lactamase class D